MRSWFSDRTTVFLAGVIVVLASLTWLRGGAFLVTANSTFVGMIMLRINDEEVIMKGAFGQSWEGYCEHS